MGKTICYIFGAGEYGEMNINANSVADGFIVAADGGYSYLKQNNIVPDLVVGDFDSLSTIPRNLNIIKHPVMKDDTDMVLAVNEGFKHGCNKFVIYGGLGGRLDHTIANIQVLSFIADNKGIGFLIGGDTTVTVIHNNRLCFTDDYSGIISVFSSGSKAEGVYLNGLKYRLDNAVLTSAMPLGVSNEFTKAEAQVTVENGALIVMWTNNINKELPECCNELN